MLLRNKLLIGTTLLSLLFNPLKTTAEESIRLKQPPTIERTLEEKILKPKIEINLNYETETEQKIIDYLSSKTTLWTSSQYPLWRESNIPKLSEIEKQEIKNIMKGIKDQNINSYQELIEISKNLSENQKLDLLSTLSAFLNWRNYVISYGEIPHQEEFFKKIQDSSISNNQNPIEDCGGISTFTERYLNSIRIKSAAVTGLRHAYNISKIENGTAIIDYGSILIASTKNIEKTLEAYQKEEGETVFQHLFFEDTQFKYRLINKEGRNFLDFIGYDEFSKPLKDLLIYGTNPQAGLTIALNLEDYLISAEFNLSGFFLKAGQIRGSSSSSLNRMNLIQTGFKRKFSIPDIIDINPDLSLLYGSIFQNNEPEAKKVFGINGSLLINTNKQKGLNLSSRIAGDMFGTKYGALFHDFVLGAGISYKIPIKNINIEPYIVSQFTFFPKDIGTYKLVPKPSELISGMSFNAKFKNAIFSVEPYYLKRIWEQGFGGNVKLEGKNIGINAKADATWSNYEFCPDKVSAGAGLDFKLKNFELGINYELKRTNYDREIENQSSLDVQADLKF